MNAVEYGPVSRIGHWFSGFRHGFIREPGCRQIHESDGGSDLKHWRQQPAAHREADEVNRSKCSATLRAATRRSGTNTHMRTLLDLYSARKFRSHTSD